jgi:hypothetical protein
MDIASMAEAHVSGHLFRGRRSLVLSPGAEDMDLHLIPMFQGLLHEPLTVSGSDIRIINDHKGMPRSESFRKALLT